MHVGNETPVISFRSHRATEQHVGIEREGLTGFVGPLGRGLIDVEDGSVSLRESLRHPRPRKDSWHVVYPSGRPVVIVRIQSDSMRQLDLRMCVVIAPYETMRSIRLHRRQVRECCVELRELSRKDRLE